jgi:predicted transcriptional regulator
MRRILCCFRYEGLEMADEPNLVEMTIEVVANYVAHNTIAPDDVPGFIAKTHAAIKQLTAAEPEAPTEAPESAVTPAVSVRKSLASREHILSLIDGKPYKTLKRHLSGHGLTPAQYRERYDLKPDYPMVAPAYSEHRREVAKTLGLGRKVTGARTAASTAEPLAVVETPVPAKRGRKPAAAKAEVPEAATPEPVTARVAPKSTARKAAAAKSAAPKPKATKRGPSKAAPAKPRRAAKTPPAVDPASAPETPAS